MKHESADKYTIAWFKIAECVARREREKALGVYRLLSHSIDDKGLVKQLEGDILLSFNEVEGAIERYVHAVEIYKKNSHYLQAAAVCEQILLLAPSVWHHKITIIILYEQLCKQDLINKHVEHALNMFVQSNNNKSLQQFLADLREVSPDGYSFAQEYLLQ